MEYEKAEYTVGQIANELAAISDKSEDFIARQLRNFVRTSCLTPRMYAGAGKTAPALFSKLDVCWALVAHNLASLGFEYEVIERASRVARNLDERSAPTDNAIPSDGLSFAIVEALASRDAYLHLAFAAWNTGAQSDLSGYISSHAVPIGEGDAIAPKRCYLTVPLTTLFKPLIAGWSA